MAAAHRLKIIACNLRNNISATNIDSPIPKSTPQYTSFNSLVYPLFLKAYKIPYFCLVYYTL